MDEEQNKPTPVDENIFKNLPPLDRTYDTAPLRRLQFQEGNTTGKRELPPVSEEKETDPQFLRQMAEQGTGRFRKSPQRVSRPEDLTQDTQKIILFPTDEPPAPVKSMNPPKTPIMFTAPLPKVKDLPPDFIEEGELEELDNANLQSPDYSRHLRGDMEEEDFSEFEGEESKLSSFIKDLERKADEYADGMFQEAESQNWEDIERLERLIPGTDQEDGKRIRPPSREKPKRSRPVPPDIDPKTLGQQLHKGHRERKIRGKAMVFLVLCSSLLSFFPLEFSGDYLWLSQDKNQILCLAYLLLTAMLLCGDLLWKGFFRGMRLRVGVDTLGLFSGIFCLLDCVLQYSAEVPRGQKPYATLVIVQLAFLAYGDVCKRKANLSGCQVACKMEEPYLISLEEGKWNNRNTYTKSTAPLTDFTSQLQQDDGAQNIFAFFAPVFLILSFSLATQLTRNTEEFVWALSAFLLVSAPFGGGFVYGRPAKKVALRLKDLYTALAGWAGIAKIGHQCVIGDSDLFPVGDVRITGRQEYNGFTEKKVLAYTTSLLDVGDVGCKKLFLDMMAYRGQKCSRCKKVAFHDGGGISAEINGEDVMVGGAAFMELMRITIPEGLFVNHAVFCAVNGRLAGFFALEYSLNNIVNHSLDNLLYERIRPVLATRDFSLTPEILRKRFHLNTVKMDFPSVMRRYDLSSQERPKEGRLCGILTREGIASVADCVIGAKRLRATVLQGVGICLFSALLGLSLVAYLVTSQAYTALSPENLMIFMLLWTAPVWVVTDLPQKF